MSRFVSFADLGQYAGRDDIVWRYQPAVDGPVLRLWHDGEEWRLSTTNLKDAFNAYWGDRPSFGDQFDACAAECPLLLEYYKTFDRSLVYYFALINGQHVLRHVGSDYLVFLRAVSVADHRVLYLQDLPEIEDISGLRCCPHFDTDDTILGLCQDIVNDSQFLRNMYRGIIVDAIESDGTEHRCLIDSFDYTRLAKLRGNCPSLYERWRELTENGDDKSAQELTITYALDLDSFRVALSYEKQLCVLISQMYVDTHVRKEYRIDEKGYRKSVLGLVHARHHSEQVRVSPGMIAKHMKQIRLIFARSTTSRN